MPNPVKNAPVTVLTAAEATSATVLTFLVAHGVISSSVASTYGPFAALVLVAGFGAAKWGLVSPYAKVRDALEQAGLLSDADLARIEAAVESAIGLPALEADSAGAGAPTP